MSATMKDVATRAGVSVKTVSRVVNREPYIRPETVARVEAAIAELDWVSNRSARALRTGRTGNIGVVVTELRRPYLAMLVESLVHEAGLRGLTATVEPTHGSPERVVEALRAAGYLYDGVILVDPPAAAFAQRRPAPADPVVVVHGRGLDLQSATVDEDLTEAAGLIAHHLRLMGRSRPVLLGWDRSSQQGDGSGPSPTLLAALLAEGIDGAAVPRIPVDGSPDRQAGASASGQALELRPDLDALVCMNDEVAIGALATLSARAVPVPEAVSVIGYGNLTEGRFTTPTLTTVDPGVDRIARAALDLLTEGLSGRGPSTPRRTTVPVTLRRRESTMGVVS